MNGVSRLQGIQHVVVETRPPPRIVSSNVMSRQAWLYREGLSRLLIIEREPGKSWPFVGCIYRQSNDC